MGRVWSIAAVLLPLVVVLREAIYPHDVFWHLAYGRAIWAARAIPTVDTFSFTRAGEPFFDQPWLAQLVMYGLYAHFGLRALVVLQLGLVATAFALVTRAARTDEGAAGRAALLVALPLAMNNLGIRPQSFAIVPFALFVLALSKRRFFWALPIVMAIWVNVHGSFVLGVGLVTLYALLRRAPWWAPIATLTATLANPRGPYVFRYVLGLVGHSAMGRVEEWSGPSAPAIVFAIVLVISIALAKQRPPRGDLLVLGAFAAFGLLAPRNAIWTGLACAPILAPVIAERLTFDPEARSRPLGVACALAAIAIAVLAIAKPPALADTPTGAMDALAAAHVRRVLTTEGAASYMMWAAPDQKTLVDTRIELFPPSLWDDWAAMMRGERPDLVARWDIDAILVEPRHAALRAWAERAGWRRAHEDTAWSLWVRPPL